LFSWRSDGQRFCHEVEDPVLFHNAMDELCSRSIDMSVMVKIAGAHGPGISLLNSALHRSRRGGWRQWQKLPETANLAEGGAGHSLSGCSLAARAFIAKSYEIL
jgi:hypothetical protein